MATTTSPASAENANQMRFGSLDDLQITQILRDRESPNTKKSSRAAANIFRSYLTAKSQDPNFENYDSKQLDAALFRFFAEVRNSHGDFYKKSSMVAIRHGLSRHLRHMDIIKSSEFQNSNDMFRAMLKELKRHGKAGRDHYEPIKEQDLQALYQYFDLKDAKKLQEKIFVDIVLNLGFKGRVTMRDLKISDFESKRDEAGHLYIYMTTDPCRASERSTPEVKMYEHDDKTICPVRSFLLYKSKLNPLCQFLFPQTKTQPSLDRDVWYNCIPLGANTLGKMMTNLSKKAQLSQIYSNFCLRATSKFVKNTTLNSQVGVIKKTSGEATVIHGTMPNSQASLSGLGQAGSNKTVFVVAAPPNCPGLVTTQNNIGTSTGYNVAPSKAVTRLINPDQLLLTQQPAVRNPSHKDGKVSSTATAPAPSSSPSTPVPVHLYQVKAHTDQTALERPHVFIKTERETDDLTNEYDIKQSESETAGSSISLNETMHSTTTMTTEGIHSLLGNGTPDLLTNIKTETVDFDYTTPESSADREVTLSPIQAVTSGEITPQTAINEQQSGKSVASKAGNHKVIVQPKLRKTPVLKSRKNYSAVQSSSELVHKSTDTRDCELGIDQERLIYLDPSRVIVLDESQVSGSHLSQLPGFDPAGIPGFDPSRIPGYDPSQQYKAIYINWNESVCKDPIKPMDLPQSSEPQTDVPTDESVVQEGVCPSDNLTTTIEDVVRFTECIQDAREKVHIALEDLKASKCSCLTRMTVFIIKLEKMLDLANNNVLNLLSLLTASAKQQQTQFLQLADVAKKLEREQDSIEEQLLNLRKINSYEKDFVLSKRILKTASQSRERISEEEICSTNFAETKSEIQKTKQMVRTTQKSTLRCNSSKKLKLENDKKSQGQLSNGQKINCLRLESNASKQKSRVRPDTVKFLKQMKLVKEKCVSVSLVRRNPDLCEKYTGFSNYAQLKGLFNKIVADPNFRGHKTESGESCLRKLSLESEFLMTLVKIKLMVPLCYLCSQYKVPRSVVRETVVKWTGVLMKTLRGMDRESKSGSMQRLFIQTKRTLKRIQNIGAYK